MLKSFTTSDGEVVKGKRLKEALNTVANDWQRLAYAIRKENKYASHVTESRKELNLQNMLEQAEAIRAGHIESVTIWQRVNTVLTGKCIPIISPESRRN